MVKAKHFIHIVSIFINLSIMSIRSALQYKISFFIDIVTSISMFIAEFMVVYLLIYEADGVSGWTAEQLAVMYIITLLAGAIEIFFTDQMRNFSNKIVSGKLDLDLIRPIHPLIKTASDVTIGGLLNVILFSIVVIIYISNVTPEIWSSKNIFIFIFSVIGGAMIFSSITIFSSALSFWTFDSQFFYRLVKQGTRQMLWYPLEIYNNFIKAIFTFVIPLAFVSYYPALIIFNKRSDMIPAKFGYCSCLIGAILIFFAVLIWNKGLKHYEGSGC